MEAKFNSKNCPVQLKALILFSFFMGLLTFFIVFLLSYGRRMWVASSGIESFITIQLAYLIFFFLSYKNFEFSLEEDFLCIKKGILRRQEHHFPYHKIQNVTVVKSFLDNFMGTGTVFFENASKADNSLRDGLFDSTFLPFLLDKDLIAIKEECLKRMKN